MRFTHRQKNQPEALARAHERRSNAAGELVTDLFGDNYEAVGFGGQAAYTRGPACYLRDEHAALDFIGRLRMEPHQWLPLLQRLGAGCEIPLLMMHDFKIGLASLLARGSVQFYRLPRLDHRLGVPGIQDFRYCFLAGPTPLPPRIDVQHQPIANAEEAQSLLRRLDFSDSNWVSLFKHSGQGQLGATLKGEAAKEELAKLLAEGAVLAYAVRPLSVARSQAAGPTAAASGGSTQPSSQVSRKVSASPNAAAAPAGSEARQSGSSTPQSPKAPPSPKSPAPKLDPWLQDVLKIMCPQDKAFLKSLETRGVQITAYDRIYFDDPYYDGAKWTTKRFNAGGTTGGNAINMIRSSSAQENAATIFHEGVHTGQPASMAWRDKEYEAYALEDQWRISHGIAAHDPAFRATDAAGKVATNVAAVRAFVDKEYPGVTAAPASGSIPDQIVGRDGKGNTILERGDGSQFSRAPKLGDSYPGPQNTVPTSGIPVDMSKLQCP